MKIHELDKVLENVLQEQRASLAAEIEEALSDFDPVYPPGEPVLQPDTPTTEGICGCWRT